MEEFIVDLFPKGGGFPTKTRVFAGNQAAAIVLARKMNPNYRTGHVQRANQ